MWKENRKLLSSEIKHKKQKCVLFFLGANQQICAEGGRFWWPLLEVGMGWRTTFSTGSNCWTFDQLTALLCQHSHTTGTNDNEHQWSCIPVSSYYTRWRELASMEGQQEQHPDGVRSYNHQDRRQSSTALRHHLGWHDDTSCACPFWERDSSSVTIPEVSSLFPN